jgi:hypothetical protein
MRYFVDAEFNGFGGELISLAAVPETGARPHFYEAVGCQKPSLWVRINIIPVLQVSPRSWGEVAHLFATYLGDDPAPVIVSDCPEALAHAAMLLVDRGGQRLMRARVRFELLPETDFSAQAHSETPFNAYRDAIALRDWVLAEEARTAPRPKAVPARTTLRRAKPARRRAADPAPAALPSAPVSA